MIVPDRDVMGLVVVEVQGVEPAVPIVEEVDRRDVARPEGGGLPQEATDAIPNPGRVERRRRVDAPIRQGIRSVVLVVDQRINGVHEPELCLLREDGALPRSDSNREGIPEEPRPLLPGRRGGPRI